MVEAPLRLALAKSYDARQHDPAGMGVSEKMDGMRAFWDGHRLLSRTGHLVHAPASFLSGLPVGFPLDGELWRGRGGFQECMSVVRSERKDEAAWDTITYVVFDTLGSDAYASRMARAERALETTGAVAKGRVTLLPWSTCLGGADLTTQLSRVEAEGGEGLMLRDASGPYPSGRTDALLKVKSAHDAEAVVVGYVPGKGKHAGRAGALLCDDVSTGTRFRLGTGLSDAERERPPALGSLVTYQFFERTKSGAPRFPVFLRERVPE